MYKHHNKLPVRGNALFDFPIMLKGAIMEKELFHENLSRLYERFGSDTTFISLNKASKYCKSDCRTLLADKTFPIEKRGGKRNYKISLLKFARWLS